jgi:hypothetical protein
LIYFFFIPIVLASDGLMTLSYFGNWKTFGFLLSFFAVISHFMVTDFIMLEKDYRWIVITLCLWAMFNLTTEVDGLFFREMKGSKNIIKISLASFFIVSTTCLFFVLTQLSQFIKKVSERQEIRKILKEYGRATYNSNDDNDDDAQNDSRYSTDSQSEESDEGE